MYNIKIILSILVALVIVQTASAQAPNWTVNPSAFQYTMTVTAFLNLEGRTLASEQDMAGAFVGDETRGSAKLIYVEGADRYLAFLTIYANSENDQITFRIYDSANGAIVSVDKTLDFVIDGQNGNVFQAFSLAQPALNNEAAIKNFHFTNIDTISTHFSGEYLDIVVEYNKEITAIIPEFTISEGAKMFIDKELQVSGDTALDFTFPQHYSVLSEDESMLMTYQIKVDNEQMGGDPGFVSSNVITANKDGDNDYWIVQDASSYDDYNFRIFDVNGRILYESIGYNNDWDGYYKGRKLDRGKYYFEVENKEKSSMITGNILMVY